MSLHEWYMQGHIKKCCQTHSFYSQNEGQHPVGIMLLMGSSQIFLSALRKHYCCHLNSCQLWWRAATVSAGVRQLKSDQSSSQQQHKTYSLKGRVGGYFFFWREEVTLVHGERNEHSARQVWENRRAAGGETELNNVDLEEGGSPVSCPHK